MFSDPSSHSFYRWGGYIAYSESTDAPASYWRFESDQRGDGQWHREASTNPNIFRDLHASEGSASVGAADAGFVFGGKFVDGSRNNVAGFAVYNFTTGEWAEETEVSYSTSDGSLWGGTATYVSRFGSRGVIFVLGGMRGRERPPSSYLPFDTVHFYDVGTRTWHQQAASGDGPSRRHLHCAVGTGGNNDNNTYEM